MRFFVDLVADFANGDKKGWLGRGTKSPPGGNLPEPLPFVSIQIREQEKMREPSVRQARVDQRDVTRGTNSRLFSYTEDYSTYSVPGPGRLSDAANYLRMRNSAGFPILKNHRTRFGPGPG